MAARTWVRRQSLRALSRRPSFQTLGRRGSVFAPTHKGVFGSTRRKLSVREEATVREVFDLFDEDGNGIISRDEVAIVIQSMLGNSMFFLFLWLEKRVEKP